MSDRPTFEYKGNPVRAAGILIYTKHYGKKIRLFREVNGKMEDIGGKTDAVDDNILQTAAREVCEETDGRLFSSTHTRKRCFVILMDLLQQTEEIEYNKRCKYLLFKIQVNPAILQEDMRRFGLEEKTDWGILKHYYKWHKKMPPHHKLHYRLRNLNI